MERSKWRGFQFIGVAFWWIASVIAGASTYPCILNHSLGVRGCLCLGLAMGWFAAWTVGFATAKTFENPGTQCGEKEER
jgi:hypothetical protein